MLSVRPRGCNAKSGNLLPLTLQDVIFVIFAIAQFKKSPVKTLPRISATQTLISYNKPFCFCNAASHDFVACVFVLYLKFLADALEHFL